MSNYTRSIVLLLLMTAMTVTSPGAEESKQQADKPSGMPVETVEVKTAPLKSEITATGTLYANESVIIASEIAGRVTEISFTEGQNVSVGDVLIRLDQSILSAQRDRARASLKLSETNIKRAELLLEEQAISVRERDEAYAQWRLDEASLRLAEAQLAKTEILAPFDGLIGLRRVSIGEYLQPGEAIVALNEINPIKVDFRIPEVFAHQLRSGQKIKMSVDAVPGQEFDGQVYAIDPQVDVNGRSVLLRAKVEQQDGPLRPGMFARVALILEERPRAIMIPEEALIPGSDSFQVFKVVDGKVQPATVSIGLRVKGKVEIASGLEPGDIIITAGQIKVRPGMPVTALPATSAAAGNGN